MKDFRNKKIFVEYDRALIGSFEIDNNLKFVPNKDVTWDAGIGEFQIKNTKDIKFKDYEISYFFVYINLEDELPDEVTEEIYVHSQAVIKINEEDECYYDPHQKKFFYSGLNDAEEFDTWEEVLNAVANKTIVIRTIKY